MEVPSAPVSRTSSQYDSSTCTTARLDSEWIRHTRRRVRDANIWHTCRRSSCTVAAGMAPRISTTGPGNMWRKTRLAKARRASTNAAIRNHPDAPHEKQHVCSGVLEKDRKERSSDASHRGLKTQSQSQKLAKHAGHSDNRNGVLDARCRENDLSEEGSRRALERVSLVNESSGRECLMDDCHSADEWWTTPACQCIFAPYFPRVPDKAR